MLNFNKMPFIYWNDIVKASYLQRQILVHSILYYQMNENVISDSEFDSISKQLVRLRNRMDDSDYQKTNYYYCFQDFDASTGFYLYDALNARDKKYLSKIARQVLLQYKKEGGQSAEYKNVNKTRRNRFGE